MSSARPLFVHGGGKKRNVVEVEDGTLLRFAAFKDLQVSVEEDAKAEVPLEVLDLWVVPKRATGDANIGDVYGVALEDEDEASDEEDSDRVGEVASSSSSNLPNVPTLSSTSANPSAQLVFKYDVDLGVQSYLGNGNLLTSPKCRFGATVSQECAKKTNLKNV